MDTLQKARSLAAQKFPEALLDRALALAQSPSFQELNPNVFEVPSSSTGWRVIRHDPLANTVSACDCPDRTNRRRTCKHMLAVMLAVRAAQIESAEAWMEASEAVERDERIARKQQAQDEFGKAWK